MRDHRLTRVGNNLAPVSGTLTAPKAVLAPKAPKAVSVSLKAPKAVPRKGNTLAPVSGTLTAPKAVLGRGESRTTAGGAVGIFVGTSPNGLEWYAYRPQDFLELCSHFDRRTR